MSFLGIGAGAKREAERKARDAQNQANRKAVKAFNNEQKRKTEYAKEGLEIKKRNDTKNRDDQNQRLDEQYEFAVEQRDYEFRQAMSVFDTQMQS